MTKHDRTSLLFAGVVAVLAILPTAGHAQEKAGLKILVPDPTLQGDGTMSPATAAAKNFGPLRLPADVELKAAADRAHAKAVQSGALHSSNWAQAAANGGPPRAPLAPTVVGTLKFAGLSGGTADTNDSPPDNEGAIGSTRYIQTINAAVSIYNRVNKGVIATGSLNALNGFGSNNNSFDPQIIWDPTTNRFYYLMDTIVNDNHNLLTFGWSKTKSPATVSAADWCQYAIDYGTPFPDYPKLGDSQFFMIFGVNVFSSTVGSFVGSDIIAVSKPPVGTTCPNSLTLKTGLNANLKDSGGTNQVFTPVPSNQIDDNTTGYVVARSASLPSTSLWFFNVTKAKSGYPVFGAARGVTVASYTAPANATQATFPTAPTSTLIDTSDARNTQAVQAINPARGGTIQSFWTQHTIADGSFSGVRWYEIDPAPATPVVLRTGTVTSGNTAFIFNGAISPDRRKYGATVAFGDSFVIQYNVSSPSIPVRIVAGSSVAGAAMTFLDVIDGVGPYRDFTCQTNGSVCRWGDYAAATPDPLPQTSGIGEIWGTNQYSGLASPPANGANWRTEIFALQP